MIFLLKVYMNTKSTTKFGKLTPPFYQSKTVGVMGDNRTYEYICLLRAITSEDGMTADYFNFKKRIYAECF